MWQYLMSVGVGGDRLAAGPRAERHPGRPTHRILDRTDAAVQERRVDNLRVVRRRRLHHEPPMLVVDLGEGVVHAAGLVRAPHRVEPVPPEAPVEPGVALEAPDAPGDGARLPPDGV